MNLPSPPTRFDNHMEMLGSAVEEAVYEHGSERDTAIAIDGTWQKHEHTSLNGVDSAISVDTGKAIDVAVKKKKL